MLRLFRLARHLALGGGLSLLLQLAALLGATSEASAQTILTNDYSGGDGFRYYYTYYVAGTQWVFHGFYEVWQGTTLLSREHYRNGVRHGSSATFFADGDTATLVNYVDGSLEGEASSWYENGRLMEVETYVGNVLNGPYQKWYETGLNMEVGDYVDGVKFMTEWWSWYANGRMSYHREVFDNLTTDTEWYDDGKMKAYTEYMDGLLNGVRKTWDTDGSRTEAHYLEGQAHGLYVAWDASGNKTYEARSEYDQLISNVLWSYVGSVMTSESPRDGDNKLHGVHKEWYPSGAIKLVEPYTHGVLHGVRLEWYENGQQAGYSEYRDGQPVGMMRSWYDNGVLASQAFMSMAVRMAPTHTGAETGFRWRTANTPTAPRAASGPDTGATARSCKPRTTACAGPLSPPIPIPRPRTPPSSGCRVWSMTPGPPARWRAPRSAARLPRPTVPIRSPSAIRIRTALPAANPVTIGLPPPSTWRAFSCEAWISV